MRYIGFYLDRPESVRCNSCGKLVLGKKDEERIHNRTKAYLKVDEDEDTLGYPRCKECIEKEV